MLLTYIEFMEDLHQTNITKTTMYNEPTFRTTIIRVDIFDEFAFQESRDEAVPVPVKASATGDIGIFAEHDLCITDTYGHIK